MNAIGKTDLYFILNRDTNFKKILPLIGLLLKVYKLSTNYASAGQYKLERGKRKENLVQKIASS